MAGFRSALAVPLGIGKPPPALGFRGLPWFRGGVVSEAVVIPPAQPDRYGSGQYREPAKLILSWLPPKKKKPKDEEKVAVVEDAIEQALEAAPIAPPINPQEIELAARLLLAEYSLAELRRIKYADTLLERIQTVMAEMDDEDVLLLAA